MLGRGRVWVGGYLYSRWGLFAGTVCWCCLAGLVFLVWLAPPAGGWRRVSAARTTESPPIASPWGAAAAVPPSGTELSTATEDAASAGPITAGGIHLASGMMGAPVCGPDAEREVQSEPGVEGKRPWAASAASAARTTVLVRHRVGSVAGREAAQLIADEARRTGVKVVGIRPVPTVPDRREVHYLRDEDAAEGERLASQLRQRWGNTWKVREKRPATATPKTSLAALSAPVHTLEVWLPHR
jgi:hypothetical protein